jgi:ketosteroid isomerase-like protein
MKSPRTLVATAIFGVLGVLSLATPSMAAGIDDNAKVLAGLDDQWSNSAAKKDADLLASFYAEDATVYPPNDLVITGRPAAKKFWATALADPTYSVSWKTVTAQVSKSGELGFAGGTYEESYKGADGKMVKNTGKYVEVWAKDQDGNWKAIHDIWNPDK